MIYSFITNKDIDLNLKQHFLDQVATNVPHVVKKAENAAVSLMKSKLNSRYDLDLVFPIIKEWKPATEFVEDQYCSKNDVIYRALRDNTGQAPGPTNADDWEEEDPRDMLLVIHCVSITVYHLLKSSNPRKISQDVMDNYHEAIDWMDDVMKGRENPLLPLIEEPDGMDIKYGSNEEIDHYW